VAQVLGTTNNDPVLLTHECILPLAFYLVVNGKDAPEAQKQLGEIMNMSDQQKAELADITVQTLRNICIILYRNWGDDDFKIMANFWAQTIHITTQIQNMVIAWGQQDITAILCQSIEPYLELFSNKLETIETLQSHFGRKKKKKYNINQKYDAILQKKFESKTKRKIYSDRNSSYKKKMRAIWEALKIIVESPMVMGNLSQNKTQERA